MAELNEKQLVLLNSLVYLDANYAPGTSVSTIVNDLLAEGVLEKMDIGGGMTKADAEEMLKAIAKDETLCALRVDSCVDTEIRGVCFVNSDNEATIVYRGTGPDYAAWDDNCQGGYLSDTDMQQEALEFAQDCARRYDDITVSGHSKGGNMAQYVTVLMGDEVDRCVSFDGQGFSDEFHQKYKDEIDANSSKIRNVCAYNDYVNILMTSIAGETVYLKNDSKDVPKGGHYIYDLYRTPGNELNADGEYVENADQIWYIDIAKVAVKALTTYTDLMGYGNPLKEFLIYSFIGVLMGALISDEGRKWENFNWKKVLEEFLENLEDYIESGFDGKGDRGADNYDMVVNTDALRDYSSAMSTAKDEIEILRGQIKKLQKAMATNIIKGVAVGLPLQIVLEQLDTEIGKLEKLAMFLNSSADQYDTAESAAKGYSC